MIEQDRLGQCDQTITPFMTTDEVAQFFRRTTRTIRNWVRAGHLRQRRLGGGVFFLRTDIEKMALNGFDESALSQANHENTQSISADTPPHQNVKNPIDKPLL